MNNDKYNDIINLPHHTSNKHPRMSMHNRAGQFAPFAALTGYSDAVKETARITDNRIEIDDGIKLMLSDKLNYLKDNKDISATFTYFVHDKKKKGGSYVDTVGSIKKLDIINKIIVLNNNEKIPINELINII